MIKVGVLGDSQAAGVFAYSSAGEKPTFRLLFDAMGCIAYLKIYKSKVRIHKTLNLLTDDKLIDLENKFYQDISYTKRSNDSFLLTSQDWGVLPRLAKHLRTTYQLEDHSKIGLRIDDMTTSSIPEQCDIVFVIGGINDFMAGRFRRSPETIRNSWERVIGRLRENNPDAIIIFLRMIDLPELFCNKNKGRRNLIQLPLIRGPSGFDIREMAGIGAQVGITRHTTLEQRRELSADFEKMDSMMSDTVAKQDNALVVDPLDAKTIPDLAADGFHPGRLSHHAYANKIVKDLVANKVMELVESNRSLGAGQTKARPLSCQHAAPAPLFYSRNASTCADKRR